MKLIASTLVIAMLASGCAPAYPQRYVYNASYNVPQYNQRMATARYASGSDSQPVVTRQPRLLESSPQPASSTGRELTDGEKMILYPVAIIGAMAITAAAIGAAAREARYESQNSVTSKSPVDSQGEWDDE